ncbi:MAG: hypothetical protein J7L74_02255 [Candidatus Hydrothermae bacterium]|uniref:Uncharacterized protein n=1 Tax=candidate division WOR-3 bacterium TaxID=2052148 RepID=A0A7C1BIN6_UNCW3|nr:hypothetical protein [Candidatus Hydrothermae bacterium]RKY95499.1 MAG: hypothetical protein DRQ06_03590 [Candidatus Hydrothermae bacterium]RKZ00174.1 MAG: hypothetical protein DRQ04_06490 [Candidatus Hydrothermae bacterium]HDM89973.1 hypothetical protein [candidate division WOR-3 bacterium]
MNYKKAGLFFLVGISLLATACTQVTRKSEKPLVIFDRKGGFIGYNQRLVLYQNGQAVYRDLKSGSEVWFRVREDEVAEILELIGQSGILTGDFPRKEVYPDDIYFNITVNWANVSKTAFLKYRTLKGPLRQLVDRLNDILDKKAWPRLNP